MYIYMHMYTYTYTHTHTHTHIHPFARGGWRPGRACHRNDQLRLPVLFLALGGTRAPLYCHCSPPVLQCVAVCCRVLQCVAVRCSALQCVTVDARSLWMQNSVTLSLNQPQPHLLSHTQTHTHTHKRISHSCNTLQHATHITLMQSTATCNAHHTDAIHCNMQRTSH